MPIGAFKDGQFYAVHADHLGTPRLITDGAKAVVWQRPYGAFTNKPTGVLKTDVTKGKPGVASTTQLKATVPSLDIKLGDPGQYCDRESALCQNWWRYLLASKGDRYTQFDPLGLLGGWNGFSYVGGNPLTRTDSTGLFVPALALPFIAGNGIGLAGWGSAAAAAAAILTMASMSGDTPATESRAVPYPERRRGKYTCICRANKDGRSPDNCSNDNLDFAMGYGEGVSLSEAKRAAEKDAKEKLRAKSTHHIQCRCIGPNGDRIIPHG